MGFGSRLYDGHNYIDGEKSLEKDYKRKKIFFITILIFFIIGFIFVFWSNILEAKNNAKRLPNYYYVYASHQIVDKTKQLAEENYLKCDDYDYSNDSGIYYVQYGDMGNVAYFPFYYMRDVIEGYVIIDNSGENTKYYISMSDGTYGFDELLIDDVKLKNISEFKQVNYKNENEINYCENTKAKVSVGEM